MYKCKYIYNNKIHGDGKEQQVEIAIHINKFYLMDRQKI